MEWDVCTHSKKNKRHVFIIAGCKPTFTLYEVTYLLCAWNKYLSRIRAGWQNHLKKQLHIQLLNLIIHFLLCIMVGISQRLKKQAMCARNSCDSEACERMNVIFCQVVGRAVWYSSFSLSQIHLRYQCRETDWDFESFLPLLIIAGHHLVKRVQIWEI